MVETALQLKQRIDTLRHRSPLSLLENKAAEAYNGHVFVSHTSADHDQIKVTLLPAIDKATRGHFFIASKKSGQTYDVMVSGALRGSKTVVLAISTAALRSPWVEAECLWALEQRHPIIACSLDGADPRSLNRALKGLAGWTVFSRSIRSIDCSKLPSAIIEQNLQKLLSSRRFGVGTWRGRPLGQALVPGPEMVANLDAGEYLWNRMTSASRD